MRAGTQFKKSVSKQEEETWGLTHGDDFVVTGSMESLLALKTQLECENPSKASILGAGSAKSIKARNRRICWRDIAPT